MPPPLFDAPDIHLQTVDKYFIDNCRLLLKMHYLRKKKQEEYKTKNREAALSLYYQVFL